MPDCKLGLKHMKSLAKKLKRSEGIGYNIALERIAKEQGYRNYQHAFNELSKLDVNGNI